MRSRSPLQQVDYHCYFADCSTRALGEAYSGLGFGQLICGVAILRAGKSTAGSQNTDKTWQGDIMADGLRECCKSIRLCHLLIQNDEQHVPHVSPSALECCFARCCCVSDGWLTSTQVHYGKFVEDIADRHVLLMDPVIGSCHTCFTSDHVRHRQHDCQGDGGYIAARCAAMVAHNIVTSDRHT